MNLCCCRVSLSVLEVNSRDIDNAIAVMLESFIQSQKHQVGSEFSGGVSESNPLFFWPTKRDD